MPAISLLMESVRLQDELPLLQARIPDPERVYPPEGGAAEWEEAETVELAAAVWARLQEGRFVTTCTGHRRAARTRSTARLRRRLLDGAGQIE